MVEAMTKALWLSRSGHRSCQSVSCLSSRSAGSSALEWTIDNHQRNGRSANIKEKSEGWGRRGRDADGDGDQWSGTGQLHW